MVRRVKLLAECENSESGGESPTPPGNRKARRAGAAGFGRRGTCGIRWSRSLTRGYGTCRSYRSGLWSCRRGAGKGNSRRLAWRRSKLKRPPALLRGPIPLLQFCWACCNQRWRARWIGGIVGAIGVGEVQPIAGVYYGVSCGYASLVHWIAMSAPPVRAGACGHVRRVIAGSSESDTVHSTFPPEIKILLFLNLRYSFSRLQANGR